MDVLHEEEKRNKIDKLYNDDEIRELVNSLPLGSIFYGEDESGLTKMWPVISAIVSIIVLLIVLFKM